MADVLAPDWRVGRARGAKGRGARGAAATGRVDPDASKRSRLSASRESTESCAGEYDFVDKRQRPTRGCARDTGPMRGFASIGRRRRGGVDRRPNFRRSRPGGPVRLHHQDPAEIVGTDEDDRRRDSSRCWKVHRSSLTA